MQKGKSQKLAATLAEIRRRYRRAGMCPFRVKEKSKNKKKHRT